ncbi:MAG: c-type cytochrome [Steroidobacteraceae bacterium]|nr:c-type cytochrome [Steroidobacteraceae bacterium]
MLGLIAIVVMALGPTTLFAAATPNGWYTPAQATRGHQFFNNQCAQCHRPDLTGAAGPALVGPTFLAKWGNQPLSALYTFEHQKMPAVNPGSVPPDQMWAITAYILQKNGFPAGSAELGASDGNRVLAKSGNAQPSERAQR